jgi:hypothetical protein
MAGAVEGVVILDSALVLVFVSVLVVVTAMEAAVVVVDA